LSILYREVPLGKGYASTLVFTNCAGRAIEALQDRIAGRAKAVVVVASAVTVPERRAGLQFRRLDDYGDAAEVTEWANQLVRDAARRTEESPGEFFEHFPAWRDAFLHFSLWPTLVAFRRIEAALDAENPADVEAVESLNERAWWLCRVSFGELVQAACRRRGLHCRLMPSRPWRWLRRSTVTSAGWAIGAGRALAAVRKLYRDAPSLPHRDVGRPLFAFYGTAEITLLRKVVETLRRSERTAPVVLDFGFENTFEHLVQPGWEPVSIHAAAGGPPAFAEALNAIIRPVRQVLRAGEGATSRLTADMPDIKQAVRDRLRFAYLANEPLARLYRKLADHVLTQWRPSVVVTSKHLGPPAPAMLVIQARVHGIPRVFVQHGLWQDDPDPRIPLDFDRYLIFGESAREALLCAGVEPERVVVVGNAAQDEAATAGVPAKAGKRARALAAGKKVVLIGAQPGDVIRAPGTPGSWGEEVFAAARKLTDCRVIVKMHPRETEPDIYRKAAARIGADAVVVEHGEVPLSELIAVCDVFMTGYSTAAFEAMAQDKPVVTVNLSGQPDPVGFAASRAAIGVYQASEILPTLRRLLSEGPPDWLLAGQRAYLRYQMGPCDGNASERILEALEPYVGA